MHPVPNFHEMKILLWWKILLLAFSGCLLFCLIFFPKGVIKYLNILYCLCWLFRRERAMCSCLGTLDVTRWIGRNKFKLDGWQFWKSSLGLCYSELFGVHWRKCSFVSKLCLSHQKIKKRVNLLSSCDCVCVCNTLLWGAELWFCPRLFISRSESGCWFWIRDFLNQASRHTELSSYYLFTWHKATQRKTESYTLQNNHFLLLL